MVFQGELQAMGVGMAIDDFGMGYSSLSVLKYLNIDRIEIDQSFIRDIPYNTYDVGIVEAIVAMARKLGINLVAEGVENDAQLEFLCGLNCDEVQGYLLGQPILWEELVQRYSDWNFLQRSSLSRKKWSKKDPEDVSVDIS